MQDERLAHLDRALASGAEGSAFESRISHKKSCLISDSFFFIEGGGSTTPQNGEVKALSVSVP